MSSLFRTALLPSGPLAGNLLVTRYASSTAAKLFAPRIGAMRFGSTGRRIASEGTPHGKPSDLNHFKSVDETKNELSHSMHPIWSPEELQAVKITHVKPRGAVDRSAYYAVKGVRAIYDLVTGYTFGTRNEMCFLRRIIFLETIAGVPGMVGAMVRHLNSLRRMERDYGWIHTLLEEAENERMHLMTAMLLLKKPSFIIRYSVVGAQWAFLSWYTMMYFLSPRFCHRFVGYIEEEAVKTYTAMVQYMEMGKLPKFDVLAHEPARLYWQLPQGSTLKDVILCIRADETHHREVNHTFADMDRKDVNPFRAGGLF